MAKRDDFTDEQWTKVLRGPTSAGLLVMLSQRGGSFRESFSVAKAYSEARQKHGDSELLDTIVATKPDIDKTRPKSEDEAKEHQLQNVRDAVALIEQKGSKQEVKEYKQFIVDLAERVAEAHKEGFLGLSGDKVSANERTAVNEIAAALGVPAPKPA